MMNELTDPREAITKGRTALGIELGSTRIKAVLTGPDHGPIAVGSHDPGRSGCSGPAGVFLRAPSVRVLDIRQGHLNMVSFMTS